MDNEAIELANKALSIRGATHFDALIEKMRRDIAAQIIRTNPGESLKREELYQVGYGVELFVKYLDKYIENGAFEASKAVQDETP